MARILAVQGSGRPKGFTAGLLKAAVEGMESVGGVEADRVHLHKYTFGPCNSCFSCIRNEPHECVLKDDMGAEGELMARVRAANGLFFSDPVHFWGPSAGCHLFFERLYPFLWSGGLEGMPFASASCASNQGMQRLANRNICKWVFTLGFRYQGGLPVHTVGYDKALKEARALGRNLAQAALVDEKGREKYPDPIRYPDYVDQPWSVLEPYLDNLTNGRMTYEGSLIEEAFESLKKEEALELLTQAKEVFLEVLEAHRQDKPKEASRLMARASALWAHATFKEFLEEDVVKTSLPKAYRPLEEE